MMTRITKYHYVYIATNHNHKHLKLGLTGDLVIRAFHIYTSTNRPKELNDPNACLKLVFWERFEQKNEAKALHYKLKRLPKRMLYNWVDTHNPDWKCLNKEVFDLPGLLLNFHLINPKLKIQTQQHDPFNDYKMVDTTPAPDQSN